MVRIYNCKKLKRSQRSSKLRNGLFVKIMVGKYKGFTGKIIALHKASSKVEIEGITAINSKRKEYNMRIHTSNLMRFE